MPTVLVSGDLVPRGVVLRDVPSESFIAELGDRIVEVRQGLPQDFSFFKNEECTEKCKVTDPVSSLGMLNNAYLVYIRAEPAAGAYLHELAATLSFSRLND